MFKDKRVSILLPCLNEMHGLGFVLGKLPDFIDEIVVVDNGSTDNSMQVARSYNAKLLIEEKKGYGRAILKGLRYVTGDIIVIMDADGSYSVENLKEVCDFMEQGNFDFINGCRFPLVDSKIMPLENRLGNYFISWLIHKIFKIDLRDSQSGLMVFKKNILDCFCIRSLGFGFSQEIKIKSWLKNMKCAEVHIVYNARIGKAKFKKIRDGLNNLFSFFSLCIEVGHN